MSDDVTQKEVVVSPAPGASSTRCSACGIQCVPLNLLRFILVCLMLLCPAFVGPQRTQGGDFLAGDWRPATGDWLLRRCPTLVLAQRAQVGDLPRRAESLTVAAAADLNYALTGIAARFERQTGATVRLTFGSSGNLFMQIENGAPFDLFFSADLDYPRKLEAAGVAEPGTLLRYAVGRLVLWVPAGSSLQLERDGIRVLLDPAVRRIAIANPAHAPYGRAAVAALRHFGLYDQVSAKLVFGENVAQAAQFVESGNAQVGIIAFSLAVAPPMKDKGRYGEVPSSSYPALEQGAILLKSSRHQPLARRFLEFLNTAEASDILQRYGFALPESVR